MKNPLISVIITTRNSRNHITNCLRSLKKQSYKNIEIIVVDNNSSDGSKKCAGKYTKLVFNKGPERSAQKNFGVKKSHGEYLFFLDADMSLSQKLIENCVKILKNKKIVALYIPEIIVGNGFWPKVRNFERSFYNSTVIDSVRFIKKNIFEAVGGFDEKLWGGEDWDLDKRLKTKGKFSISPSPLYHNEKNFSLNKYLKKKKYYAKSLHIYKNKYGENDLDVKKQLGFYYRFFGVFVEHGKWKKLFLHPCLAISMFFQRVLVGLTYKKGRHYVGNPTHLIEKIK